MMYIEDRPKLLVLAPRYRILLVDPGAPQGTDRTYSADLATVASYLTTQGPPGPPGVANCRNARVPIGSGLLAPNAVQTLRVTWPTPFADDLYTVAWSFEASSLLGGIRAEVRARNKAYVDLAIVNGLISLTMGSVLLHVTATHDAI